MANREDLKKALDRLRKKNPDSEAFQRFDRRFRSYTGADQDSALGSIKLFDNYNDNFGSNQKPSGKRVQGLDGGWESKGYAKEMQKRKENPWDYVNTSAVEQVKKIQEKAKKEKKAKEKKHSEELKKILIPQPMGKNGKTKKKDEPFLTDVKNFFTGKDTDGDGDRDGLLGFMDRYIAPISKGATEFIAPGNEERMLQNDLAKDGKINNPVNVATQKDRGTETKVLNTAGTLLAALAPYGQAYKAADYGFNKLPKLANAVTNPYAQKAIKGAVAGGLAEGGIVAENELFNSGAHDMVQLDDGRLKINKEIANRIMLGVAGGAILDPALYGAGQAIRKGSEKYAANVMQNLLPTSQQMEEAVKTYTRSTQADNALPIARQNSNYVPNLIPPTPKPQVTAPRVGTPLDESAVNEFARELTNIPEQNVIPQTRTDIPEVDLLNPPKQEPVKTTQQVQEPLNTNTARPASKPVEQPLNTSQVTKKKNESAFYSTVQNPDKLSPELEQLLNDFDKSYKPMSNEEVVKFANEYVKNDIEKAYQFVKNAAKFDPRHITVGHRLIDELQKAGQFDRALDVVERLAEQGTKAGQSIQSFSIYNRLSAEGQLLRAQRRVNKINETITDPNKQVKLTPETMENISHTADSIQKFAGQMEQANNVMNIMEKVKKGKTATDSELETIRSFVGDAKKFFGDLDPAAAPKVPKPVKDVRTRDKVVNFMDAREQVAREELKKIFGRANSLPVDAFYHLSVIGASKMAKGTIKLTDFTEEMVRDFGETIRPYAKQIYNKAAETFNLQSESMTRQRLSDVEKITNKALKDKNLDADQAESIKEFARQVGKMSGDAKLENSMELQTILQGLERPTFGQRLSTAQTIAQLLNPKTMVRNALGNEMFYRIERINKLLATPVDIARSKVTGGARTVTFRTNNQGQYWRNWLTGAKAGWKGVNPMGLQTAYDLGPTAFKSKWNPLTYFEKALGATLRSFDHAGYMRAYNSTLGELATLKAVNQGLKGQAKKEAILQFIREADENMVQLADKYGKYSTFQDNTQLSNGLQKVKRALNFKQDFGLGDLILKYPKTPGNLVMRAIEYSPVGFLRSAHLAKHAIKGTKALATKDATEAFTRALIGTTGFSLMGYTLADLGILTSSGSADYEVAALEKSAGKQANSVNTSALWRFITSGFDTEQAKPQKGDTFISYDWAQPLAIAVGLGAGVNRSIKENEELAIGNVAKGAFDGAVGTLLEMSVLSGVKDFFTSYPGKKPSDYFTNPAKNIASSFIPTLSNQVRQLSDNSTKSTYSPNLLPEIGNRASNRIPGMQNLLPTAYDTMGKKKETYQNGSNNWFNVLFNPSFVSSYDPSPEAEFVLNAIEQTGNKNLAPRMPQKKLDDVPLTSEEYVEMQRIMGEEVKRRLAAIAEQNMSKEAAEKAIEKILTDAGKRAREEIRFRRETQ